MMSNGLISNNLLAVSGWSLLFAGYVEAAEMCKVRHGIGKKMVNCPVEKPRCCGDEYSGFCCAEDLNSIEDYFIWGAGLVVAIIALTFVMVLCTCGKKKEDAKPTSGVSEEPAEGVVEPEGEREAEEKATSQAEGEPVKSQVGGGATSDFFQKPEEGPEVSKVEPSDGKRPLFSTIGDDDDEGPRPSQMMASTLDSPGGSGYQSGLTSNVSGSGCRSSNIGGSSYSRTSDLGSSNIGSTLSGGQSMFSKLGSSSKASRLDSGFSRASGLGSTLDSRCTSGLKSGLGGSSFVSYTGPSSKSKVSSPKSPSKSAAKKSPKKSGSSY